MFADYEYERWEEWDDELLDEELEELEDADQLFEDEEDPLAFGPLAERTAWLQTKQGLDEIIESDEVLDFHFFMEGTRGICRGERNFFNRMKLYFYEN